MEKFRALGLSESTLEALKEKGFESPTPIQEQTIPLLLSGKVDVIGQAQTGTGKTAAFGLPLIEKLNENLRQVQAIVLAPTRELAMQVAEELRSLKGKKQLDILTVYGGQSMDIQLRALRRGTHIVVGTPGRVLDHLSRGTLALSNVSFFVLDEADEMLNMGFIDDVEEILRHTSTEKQMLLFSATMPDRILSLAQAFMRNPQSVTVQKQQLTTSLVDQIFYEVSIRDKFEALCRIIDVTADFYGLVFCKTKNDVDEVTAKLVERGMEAEALHGDVSQSQREKILDKFKRKQLNILVATDVAARGIDVNSLTHVVNFSLPQDPESYVHRIGRTGRAGNRGTAISLVPSADLRKLMFIKKIAKSDIRKEKLPTVQDVIRVKKQRIESQLGGIIERGDYGDYINTARTLLTQNEPEATVAALLRYAFRNDLKEDNYVNIREAGSRDFERGGERDRDSRGGRDRFDRSDRYDRSERGGGERSSRLFVALGRRDEMTPKRLVTFLKSETGVEPSMMRDVKIMDVYSFVTVPNAEAEHILQTFQRQSKGRKSLVDRAESK